MNMIPISIKKIIEWFKRQLFWKKYWKKEGICCLPIKKAKKVSNFMKENNKKELDELVRTIDIRFWPESIVRNFPTYRDRLKEFNLNDEEERQRFKNYIKE